MRSDHLLFFNAPSPLSIPAPTLWRIILTGVFEVEARHAVAVHHVVFPLVHT